MLDLSKIEAGKNPQTVQLAPAMLSKLKALPGALPAGTWANADAFAGAAINPMQFWVQFAEQWQKAWEWASADSAAAD